MLLFNFSVREVPDREGGDEGRLGRGPPEVTPAREIHSMKQEAHAFREAKGGVVHPLPENF
ncbi:hypothetical protein IT084_08665 [Desulfallas sp. Bu1-1]|jgi:hypothetical protein|uniref:hypothetical protein n=1 Tax=Desulfallas sp. Bu1-1 TaxID=2787620 RepID=UPI0018A01FB8|nr:hypothetical protein [Desulfallas sp. Bu1-1]MBF7083047.1 hypothetical protein [Desulfallas sp. Bu1-1]